MWPQNKFSKNGAAILAKSSGECCRHGTWHSGTPRGEMREIGGANTYVVLPRDREAALNRVLLYFPDVWGIFTNGNLVMDAFADAGYTVLGIDYFRGDPVWKHRKDRNDTSNPDFDYEAWKKKHMTWAQAHTPAWIDAVKGSYGNAQTQYVCVGYCFGAPFVMQQLAQELVVCGAFAHPAFLNEKHFRNAHKPLFLSCSEVDHTFGFEARQRAQEILSEQKTRFHLQLFGGVEHGFALRGNMSNPYERWVKEESLKGILSWFEFHCSQSARAKGASEDTWQTNGHEDGMVDV